MRCPERTEVLAHIDAGQSLQRQVVLDVSNDLDKGVLDVHVLS